jgi:DNA-binding transcriptional LysR family regulator
MRLDFLGLEAFLAVAERGSFHKAATHLSITQTALSHRIKKFEDALQVSLLARTTRQVSVTPAGLALLPKARRLLGDARQVFNDLAADKQARHDRIAIGCLPTLTIHLLPKVLDAFMRMHPNTRVRVFDNSATEIAERVQNGDAEFGITIVGTNRWDLDIKPLIEETYVLVCPASHPMARKASIRWADLQGERLIRISAQTGNRMLIDDALGETSEQLKWMCEVQHVASAVSLVAAGVGLTIVPRVAIDVIRASNLATVNLKQPSITRILGAVTRRGVPLSLRAGTLLSLIEAHLKRRRS